MAIHEQVQKGQLSIDLQNTAPEKYYGHAFAAMGMSPDKWHNDLEATKAIQEAPLDIQTSFKCTQGLLNTLFHPARPQSVWRKDTRGQAKEAGRVEQDAN